MSGRTAAERPLRFNVPLTGGMHQVLHLLPVAAALDRRGHDVALLVMDEPTRRFAERMIRCHGPTRLATTDLPATWLERIVGRVARREGPAKSLRLLSHVPTFRNADALIVSERTTSLLRRWRLFDGPIVHIPHGAGDRAVGYESRIARYDLHLVAGPKDRDRFVAAGLATPDRVVACGYIKMAGIERACGPAPRVFANDNPVVLYNPHFDGRLGSFGVVSPTLLRSFARRPDLNFIVAPHIRLAAGLSPARRAALIASARPNILVDLGSERSCDMSYTRAADIYLGDVSSQVYEFAARPRPAVFIDAAGADWRGDPHFAMWGMGAVVPACADAIMRAVDAAIGAHPCYLDAQRALVAAALGPDWRDAPDRAADAILGFFPPRAGAARCGSGRRKTALLPPHPDAPYGIGGR